MHLFSFTLYFRKDVFSRVQMHFERSTYIQLMIISHTFSKILSVLKVEGEFCCKTRNCPLFWCERGKFPGRSLKEVDMISNATCNVVMITNWIPKSKVENNQTRPYTSKVYHKFYAVCFTHIHKLSFARNRREIYSQTIPKGK